MRKRLWILLIATIIMTGACGCMKTNTNFGKNETSQEYAEQMLQYMEEKYDATFQVVDTIFPEPGINTGMKENVLVVEDSSGVVANVKARLGSPHEYYDDYLNSCGADQIQRSMDLENLLALGNARFYAVVRSQTLSEIDSSPAGVSSVTLVVNIPQQVTEEAMEQLYDVYCQICEAGYKKLYLIAWFTDGAEEFDQAVDNYRVHGKSDWKNYNGTVYAALKITDPDLPYEVFRNTLIEN